jgi:hypothetical protein
MRKSTFFVFFTMFNIMLLVFAALHARHSQSQARDERLYRAGLVRELRLTDLCLFTEARYTRHPSMADLHSPFQDHPGALEHFPSGSLATPTAVTARANEPHR